MGEALGTDRATLHSLDVIVTNGSGGLHARGDISIVNDLPLRCTVSPDTGETVGLQLQIDRERISLRRILTGEALYLLFDSEKILDVMTQFMSDDVSLGKICIAAAETSELIPETQVDVDLPVRGAIERASLRLGNAAT